jgi:hypothetical protein
MFFTDPKRAMYKENIRTNEDRLEDQYLAVVYPSQLKTRTEGSGEHFQEFATSIEQFTLFAFHALHEDHFCRRPRKTFGNDTRDQGIKQQVHLGGNRTISEIFRQTLELKVFTSSLVFCQAPENESQDVVGGPTPSQMKEETADC